MAGWHAEDATYGWMYSVDEHFMAVGRSQIRDYAIGIEMDGLDGWHFDYQVTMIDEVKAMVVGFWKQRSGIINDETGEELRDRDRWLVVRGRAEVGGADDGFVKFRLAARLVRHAVDAQRSSRAGRATRHPTPAPQADVVSGLDVPGHYRYQDLPSSAWPPPVERDDIEQKAPSA